LINCVDFDIIRQNSNVASVNVTVQEKARKLMTSVQEFYKC